MKLKHILRIMMVAGLSVGSMVSAAESQWTSPATQQPLAMQVLEPANPAVGHPLPLVIYLENLAAPRVGTETDATILHDFLKDGDLVVTLDYAHNAKAAVPFINQDLLTLRSGLLDQSLLAGRSIDLTHVYIVPAGCRLARNVVFYHDPNRTLAMDIIYPAHPVHPVGTVLEFSCDNQNRMGDGSLASCRDTALDGEATMGLAVAMADHPVKAPYKGIDPMPECAWKIKAAVRTLRATGAGLGLSDKIALVGFSRGSGMALMLLTTMGMPEFEGHGENTNVSSDVQGGVILSGRFTYLDLLPNDHMIPRYNKAWGDRASHPDVWRHEGALDYLQHATQPLFLSINCTEGEDAQHQMSVLRQRLAALGSPATFMLDPQPHGHAVPLETNILAAMNNYLNTCLH